MGIVDRTHTRRELHLAWGLMSLSHTRAFKTQSLRRCAARSHPPIAIATAAFTANRMPGSHSRVSDRSAGTSSGAMRRSGPQVGHFSLDQEAKGLSISHPPHTCPEPLHRIVPYNGRRHRFRQHLTKPNPPTNKGLSCNGKGTMAMGEVLTPRPWSRRTNSLRRREVSRPS